jgi:hypothetical protein
MNFDTDWFKSSYSAPASDNCVEVRLTDSQVGVRDSKCPDAGAVWLPRGSWSTFVTSATDR